MTVKSKIEKPWGKNAKQYNRSTIKDGSTHIKRDGCYKCKKRTHVAPNSAKIHNIKIERVRGIA